MAATERLNEADLACFEMYLERKDMSQSMLDSVLQLAAIPTCPTLSSSFSFFHVIDEIPGIEFHGLQLKLPNIKEPYGCAYRPAVNVVADLVAQHNGSFIDVNDGYRGAHAEFVDGERFKRLHEQLQRAAGPHAVLMPIILSSGL